jgi:hypothetical protein
MKSIAERMKKMIERPDIKVIEQGIKEQKKLLNYIKYLEAELLRKQRSINNFATKNNG